MILFYILTCGKKRRILEEVPVLDCLCDLGKVLVYDAPGAHIQVSYLGVSHLSIRKAYRHPAGIAFYKRALCHQFIHNRRFAFCYGISGSILI